MTRNSDSHDILDKFKEEANGSMKPSLVEERELLRSPRFKRMRSNVSLRSSSSSPTKSIVLNPSLSSFAQNDENDIIESQRIPLTPRKQLTRSTSKTRYSAAKQCLISSTKSLNNIPKPKFSHGSPTRADIPGSPSHNAEGIDKSGKQTKSSPNLKGAVSKKVFSKTDILNIYDFKEVIGKGAFATVFRAANKKTGDEMAIKEIFIPDDGDILEIMYEIDLLKVLRHKHIVRYYGFIRDDQKLLIFLEYCSGGSLRNIYKRSHALTEPYVIKLIKQVLDGLIYLHGQGVVHRDIKAANILLTASGDVKLTDFGVSSKDATKTIKTFSIAGTPNWMAPEIILGEGSSTASDIWSLGATIVELLKGEPMYSHLVDMAVLHAIVSDEYPPLPDNISRLCKDFLMTCFEKDHLKRKTAKELQEHPWLQGNQNQNPAHSGAKHTWNELTISKMFRSEDIHISSKVESDSVLSKDNNYYGALNEKDSLEVLERRFGRFSFNDSDQVSPPNNIHSLNLPENSIDLKREIDKLKLMIMTGDIDGCTAERGAVILEHNPEDRHTINLLCDKKTLSKLLIKVKEINSSRDKDSSSYLMLLYQILKANKPLIETFLNSSGMMLMIDILAFCISSKGRALSMIILKLIFSYDHQTLLLFLRCGGINGILDGLLILPPEDCAEVMDFLVWYMDKSIANKILLADEVQLALSPYTSTIPEMISQFFKIEFEESLPVKTSLIEKALGMSISFLKMNLFPRLLQPISEMFLRFSIISQRKILSYINTIDVGELEKLEYTDTWGFLFSALNILVLYQSDLENNRTIELLCKFTSRHANHDKLKEQIMDYPFMLNVIANVIKTKGPSSCYMTDLVLDLDLSRGFSSKFYDDQRSELINLYKSLLLSSPKRNSDVLISLTHLYKSHVCAYIEELVDDKDQVLIKSFLADGALENESYLNSLSEILGLLNSYPVANKMRLLFLNNDEVVNRLFEKIQKKTDNIQVKEKTVNLLRLLIHQTDPSNAGHTRIINYLVSLPKFQIPSIDCIIDTILAPKA